MQHEQALAALKTASPNHRSLALGDPRILQVAQIVTEDPGCSPAKCLDAGIDPHAILGALGHDVVAFTGEGNLTPLALSAVLLEEAGLRRAKAPADAPEQAFAPGAEPAAPEAGDAGRHVGEQRPDHYGPSTRSGWNRRACCANRRNTCERSRETRCANSAPNASPARRTTSRPRRGTSDTSGAGKRQAATPPGWSPIPN